MKMKEKNTFSFYGRTRTLYFMTLLALLAVGAVGYLLLPTSDTVSAQENSKRNRVPALEQISGIATEPSSQVLTPEMLRIALDFRTATEYTVFAERAINNDGKSQIKGNAGVASSDAAGATARKDLATAFNAISQLPATKIGELSNGSYRAGVYSSPTARLSGNLVLDAENDPNAIFIFRIEGGLQAANDLTITLVNGAEAYNVFFVTKGAATIGGGIEFKGSIIAQDEVTVGGGSRVIGRVLSLAGAVKLTEAAVDGGGTGILEICKAAGSTGLVGRVFSFRIGGIIREAPVGGCTGPIDLPAGPVTVEELLTGRTIAPLAVGTFDGRFRLVSVSSSVAGSLGTVNLPLRTAVVTVREGSINNQTVLTFTNVFAINAVIEICKFSLGPDVTGFFNFTIDALLNTVITVPVNGCSGPIQVNVPTTPGGAPAPATLLVTEIGRDGFTLESASTFPANAFFGLDLNVGVNNTSIACISEPRPLACFFANPGGGVADIDVFEGGVANQTVVSFFNRANPARLKICKIAGPGIPEGTVFNFEVRGTVATSPTQILPGVQVFRAVSVIAGPAAQGGFCDFVRDTNGQFTRFVVGTNIAINEIGFTGVVPAAGQIQTGNIRSSSGFTATAVSVTGGPGTISAQVPSGTVTLSAATGGNPDFDFGAANTARFLGSATIVPSRAETVEVEFTNFVFNPTILKICKIGVGITPGTPFTFNVTVTNPQGLNGNLFANSFTTVTPVTVMAGPGGGFCSFVSGPFGASSQFPGIGGFNAGSTVTITETAATGSTVTAITSPTGTVLNSSLINRTGGLTLGFAGGFNEISFVNTATTAPAPPPAARTAFDYDGDNKADVSVFRSSNGGWYINQSTAGFRGEGFGQAGDQMVPADYDGDGRTDVAVYRPSNGTWYINRTTAGFTGVNFGNATDIPQAVDFNNDGKAELAVFRPSNGYWYVMNLATGDVTATQFGQTGDQPVAADYDGDGKADYAVFRPSTGGWYILRSEAGFIGVGFGQTGDKPVPADYDGDGKADVAVYRPSNGGWYLNRSTAGFIGVAFGASNDMPAAADYDGDRKADIAVFRPSDGMFYINRSSTGFTSDKFGQNGDRPTPNAFVLQQ